MKGFKVMEFNQILKCKKEGGWILVAHKLIPEGVCGFWSILTALDRTRDLAVGHP
jgi:hypothetical protein